MSLLKHHWTTDAVGQSVLCVEKSRGKINMDELSDYLRYEAKIYSHWAIFLNATESTCDGGWLEETPKGDSILLYEVTGEDACPVCAQMTPPEYCPHCGRKIAEEHKG